MSNKVLAYSLIILLIVVVGAFFIWRISQNKADKLLGDGAKQEEIVKVATSSPADAQAQTKTETSNVCERKFDEAVLKTAKLEIKNRQVEITVKGFGKIVVEFFDTDAPKTVENFLRLTNSGYFDCLTFHRVAKGFVIQGGDPTGTGSGGQSAFGGEFADEIDPASPIYTAGYKKGILAMANRGPNTNTSQFFIMLSDAGLPPAYTIFGRVVSGLESVDKIGRVEIVPQLGPTDGKPTVPVVMESVRIIEQN